MVLRAGLEPARIAPHAPQTCAATNYATSANSQKTYLLAGAAFALLAGALFDSVPVSDAAAAFASAAKEFVAGVSISAPFALSVVIVMFVFALCCSAAGAVSSTGASALPLKTETPPLSAGIEIKSALNMKTTAAAIVSFDSTDAVPRGPNAALDTLLVKRAPASVLPG